ncbi:hypothetical protein CASFOL_041706 [Castilleja foliolosa]|uniref:Uncharacterized protein n=1 Tax=Castilleja foliolosa TaxID=1961234 RepID=A0ABD3BAP5_9LAMI
MGYVERTLGSRTRDLDDRDLLLVTEIVGVPETISRSFDLSKDGTSSLAECETALTIGAGNMVNALMRKLVLENNSLPAPKVDGNDRQQARALATIHSHPVWMVRRWTKYLGLEEAIKLMVWNNSDSCFSLSSKGFTRAVLVTELERLKWKSLKKSKQCSACCQVIIFWNGHAISSFCRVSQTLNGESDRTKLDFPVSGTLYSSADTNSKHQGCDQPGDDSAVRGCANGVEKL